MKRILHVIPYPYFYPPKTGGQLRCFHLMDQLAKNYKVDVISFLPENDLTQYGYFNKNISFYNTSSFKYNRNLFDFLPQKIAIPLKYRWWQKTLKGPAEIAFVDFYPILKRLFETNKYEFILFEHIFSMILGKISKKMAPNTLRIVDQHNVDSELYKQTCDTFINKEYQRLLKMESTLGKYADAFFSCSEQDNNTLGKLNNNSLPGFVIPNGTKIQKENSSKERFQLKKLIFCGSLDYPPNINGLLWFYAEVWPQLKKNITAIQLTIIGRNPIHSKYEELKNDEQINFLGEVDDVTPYYLQNNIAIVPLFEGSGTRLKILEAMAFGNPVISTSTGADGLNFKNRENIIIADTKDGFETVITNELISPSGILPKISSNALELIKNTYTWGKVGEQVRSALETLLKQKDNG